MVHIDVHINCVSRFRRVAMKSMHACKLIRHFMTRKSSVLTKVTAHRICVKNLHPVVNKNIAHLLIIRL